MNEELREARDLAGRIESGFENGFIEHLEPLQICSALEALAKTGDRKSFRLIVSGYVNQVRTNVTRKDVLEKDNGTKMDDVKRIERDIDNNPYVYVEWLCMLADDNARVGFSKRKEYRINPKNPPRIKKTQAFFQKLYGSKFYSDCASLDDYGGHDGSREPRIFKIEDWRR